MDHILPIFERIHPNDVHPKYSNPVLGNQNCPWSQQRIDLTSEKRNFSPFNLKLFVWNIWIEFTKNEHRKIKDTKYAYANDDPQSGSFFDGDSQSACKHESIILFHASPVAHL